MLLERSLLKSKLSSQLVLVASGGRQRDKKKTRFNDPKERTSSILMTHVGMLDTSKVVNDNGSSSVALTPQLPTSDFLSIKKDKSKKQDTSTSSTSSTSSSRQKKHKKHKKLNKHSKKSSKKRDRSKSRDYDKDKPDRHSMESKSSVRSSRSHRSRSRSRSRDRSHRSRRY